MVLDDFDRAGKDYLRENVRLSFITGSFYPLMSTFTNVSLALLIYFGGRMTIFEAISPRRPGGLHQLSGVAHLAPDGHGLGDQPGAARRGGPVPFERRSVGPAGNHRPRPAPGAVRSSRRIQHPEPELLPRPRRPLRC